jgi:hypothetical protein
MRREWDGGWKMEDKPSGCARVLLTIEVPVNSSWGDDCTVGQIYKQAADEALGYIRNLESHGRPARLTVIGEPRVTAVFVPNKPFA